MPLKGTITALITPFLNGELDEEGLKENIKQQIHAGINGLLVLGTTGEDPTLSTQEQDKVISIAVKEAKRKVPIIVGTGQYCTKKTIEKSKKAQELGADAVLIVTPYYNKPSQEGIFKHFEAISQQISLPIYLYNIPGRSGINIELPTLQRIADLPNIAGIKDASGNVLQAAEALHAIRKKHPQFRVLCGDDVLTLPMMSLGAHGIISVVSNLIPHQIVALTKHALEGRFDLAQQVHYELLPLFKMALIEVNPAPIKAAMQMCGKAAGGCRLPLCDLLPENRAKLLNLLHEMRLLKV